MNQKQTIEIRAGQWWTEPGQSDFRRMKITHLTADTVTYLDVYLETKESSKRISSRIQWEIEIEMGKMILSSEPGTGPA